MRRFAIIGHRAMSKGKLPLNDLAGGAGRMDVLIRATMAALLTSHGLRPDVEVILHLMGGPGPARRLLFQGAELKGFHAEERSIAGIIAKAIQEPQPPIGHWFAISPGFSHGGGTLQHTLKEWETSTTIVLDADAPRLWEDGAILKTKTTSSQTITETQSNQTNSATSPNELDIAFILSDDQPLEDFPFDGPKKRSLGDTWLQGHLAIGVVHFLLDEGVELHLA